jgi:crotonobetainyl-CoA:carnitine CoA-transferase CaiB-like acyl-CoA transferase
MSVLINNEIAAHSVQSSTGCLADTQLAHRQNFIWTEHPDRQCVVENTRFSLSRSKVGPTARAPFLGEHTFEVLSDFLAYDANQIADLAALEVLE